MTWFWGRKGEFFSLKRGLLWGRKYRKSPRRKGRRGKGFSQVGGGKLGGGKKKRAWVLGKASG